VVAPPPPPAAPPAVVAALPSPAAPPAAVAAPPPPAAPQAAVAAPPPSAAPPAPARGAPPSAAADPLAPPNAGRPSDPVRAAALLRRAEEALARGDVSAARSFFVRAASVDPWSAEAQVGAGKTYDPGFLAHIGANSGALADPAQARRWYDRAARLGDTSAAVLAGRLGEGR
jgi:TPR repeat protein